jgi:nucleotide-binding universal stress UspA family protein
MQRFKSILVVVDEKTENRAVVERAVTLAQRNQARLTVVNTVREFPHQAPRPIASELPADAQGLVLDIIEEWPPDAGLPISPEPPVTLRDSLSEWPPGAEMPVTEPAVVIRERIVEEESQRLEKWVDFIRRAGVHVSGKMLYGVPFLEIIREVLRNEHDLVMTTAEGWGVLREKLFGSTTMHLMRKCPCPVWVVKPSPPERYTRILAAVDPNPLDEERHAFNIKIMDLATSLARREQGELVIVHTWTFLVEGTLRSAHFMQSSEVDKWVRDARDQHKHWLAGLLRPYALGDLKHQVYMLKGEAGRLIPELAAEKDVELIVMGTVSRTGVAGLLIGNTAEKILRLVDCSVLTVKPDGFATPVRLDE